jgi:hypothetical protein
VCVQGIPRALLDNLPVNLPASAAEVQAYVTSHVTDDVLPAPWLLGTGRRGRRHRHTRRDNMRTVARATMRPHARAHTLRVCVCRARTHARTLFLTSRRPEHWDPSPFGRRRRMRSPLAPADAPS